VRRARTPRKRAVGTGALRRIAQLRAQARDIGGGQREAGLEEEPDARGGGHVVFVFRPATQDRNPGWRCDGVPAAFRRIFARWSVSALKCASGLP
jgi:hypothetical protein